MSPAGNLILYIFKLLLKSTRNLKLPFI